MTVMREETFGPVVAVRVTDSFEEALTLASSSSYGLAATVLTRDMEHAQRAWRELPVGTVKINEVFGGAPGGAAHPRHASGEGYGYGPELLDEFTVTKVVHVAAPTGCEDCVDRRRLAGRWAPPTRGVVKPHHRLPAVGMVDTTAPAGAPDDRTD
jgi:succinate-semialdehyde dehydrogenase/glutarate-semialdehyde dehydrogenase